MERPHARPHTFSTSSVTLENWEETDTNGGGAAHDMSLVAGELLKNTSAWSPLQHPFFRALWLASVVSNIGTWMQNVGAAWLMTSLTPSPTLVALVQAVTSLPVFIAALPAGALADVVDRRRLLLWTQGWMLVAAAMLGVLTLIGRTSPGALLVLTFALGLGAAMNAPAWQAIIQELVPLPELPAAVALNSIGFNLARAVGPALGGLVVATAGTGAVFLLNAASFLGVMVVLSRWQRAPRESELPAEHVLGAMQAGMRYVRYAPALRALLVRAGVFILGGSALWALLPLLAQNQLGLDAGGYGVLLGCLGAGAVAGAVLLPRARQRVSADLLVASATVLFAAVMLTLAFLRHVALLCAAMGRQPLLISSLRMRRLDPCPDQPGRNCEVARQVEALGTGGGTGTEGVVRRSALVPFGHN